METTECVVQDRPACIKPQCSIFLKITSMKILSVQSRTRHIVTVPPWKTLKAGFYMIATITAIAGKKTISNRCNHVETFFGDRSDHSNHMKTSLYGNCSAIKVATTVPATFLVAIIAIRWKPALKEYHTKVIICRNKFNPKGSTDAKRLEPHF